MVRPGLPLAHSQERIDHDHSPQFDTDIRPRLTRISDGHRIVAAAWPPLKT
jgi:hypothetical protein